MPETSPANSNFANGNEIQTLHQAVSLDYGLLSNLIPVQPAQIKPSTKSKEDWLQPLSTNTFFIPITAATNSGYAISNSSTPLTEQEIAGTASEDAMHSMDPVIRVRIPPMVTPKATRRKLGPPSIYLTTYLLPIVSEIVHGFSQSCPKPPVRRVFIGDAANLVAGAALDFYGAYLRDVSSYYC